MDRFEFLRPYIVLGIPTLLAFAGGVLYSRARAGWLRILGLIASLLILAVVSAIFFVSLVAVLRPNIGGSMSDIILILSGILFLLALNATLTPLLATWLRPRTAWIAPAVLGTACSLAALYAFVRPGGSGGPNLRYAVVLAAVLVLSPVVTWLACFFHNPRFRREPTTS